MTESPELSTVWVAVAITTWGASIEAIFATQGAAQSYILSTELAPGVLQLTLKEYELRK